MGSRGFYACILAVLSAAAIAAGANSIKGKPEATFSEKVAPSFINIAWSAITPTTSLLDQLRYVLRC